MGSLLHSTKNTRALPTGSLRYVRSDFPGMLVDAEVQWLRQNNITTIVDLREENEYKKKPCRLEREGGFTYYHMPVTGGGKIPLSAEDVIDSYLAMVDDQMDKIIRTIMGAKSNVLYFCNAGKDRTGVVSAIILKRLGFNNEVIINDYMESKENLMEVLTTYVKDNPDIDINIRIPNENNIQKVLENL
jgi:protein-tyrosine phosphatase